MNGQRLRYILGGATLGALVGAVYAYVLSTKSSPLAVFNSPVSVKEPEWTGVASEDIE